MIAILLDRQPPRLAYYITAGCFGAFTAYYWTVHFLL